MQKKQWWIIITYFLMQFSSVVGLPFLYIIGVTDSLFSVKGFVIWSLFSFLLALVVIVILSNRIQDYPFPRSESTPTSHLFGWIILGVFLAFAVQGIASVIEVYVLNIDSGSENTAQLLSMAKSYPIFFLIFIVIGPILEEIVFRKVIFGSLYIRFNFWIAVAISSLLFGVVHGELEHLLVYTAMGAVFAYLYVRTKRIIVPIVTHMTMNSFATLALLFSEEIENMQQRLQFIIGGL